MSFYKKILLVTGDLAILFLSLYLALIVRYGLSGINYDWMEHARIFAPVFVLWILIYYINQLYDFEKFYDQIFLIYSAIRSSFANFLTTIVFFYIIPELQLTPKTILLLMIGMGFILILTWRIIFNKIFANDRLLKKILIIGNNKIELVLAKTISKNPFFGYKLIGLVSTNKQRRATKIKFLGTVNDLEKILERRNIDEIAFDIGFFKRDDDIFQKISDFCLAKNVEVTDIYLLYERLTSKVPIEEIGQIWFINLNQPNKKWSWLFKRIMDIVIGLIGLLFFILLTPLLFLLVKIDSSGPYLYRQKRMGAGGKIFDIYKIRTMYENSEKDKAQWAKPGDKRITIVGRMLRKTCLDELPQFWNILVGDMSFVGPRPERPEFIAKLNNRQKLYYKRHLVKPGLTGWAQIMANYGSSYSDADEKLQYDLYYIKNRSIFLDLIIIVRTIRILFINRGGV